jgi:hypothetical protein
MCFDDPFDYGLKADLCLPPMWSDECTQFKLPWCNDTFAYSSPQAMTIYADLFNNLDRLFDDGIPFQPEIMLCEWLKRNSIKTSYDCPYPRLVRVSGRVTKLDASCRPIE